MKIVDYTTFADRTVRVSFDNEQSYTWKLGDAEERRTVIKAELIKTAGAKGEKQPDKKILDIQTTIFEAELIAPLDAIPATFTLARQSSPFIDLSSLTKAFCTKTFQIEMRRVRLCNQIRSAAIVNRIAAAKLPASLSPRKRYGEEQKIAEGVPTVDLPLAVAERVVLMPTEKQIQFLAKPKMIK